MTPSGVSPSGDADLTGKKKENQSGPARKGEHNMLVTANGGKNWANTVVGKKKNERPSKTDESKADANARRVLSGQPKKETWHQGTQIEPGSSPPARPSSGRTPVHVPNTQREDMGPRRQHATKGKGQDPLPSKKVSDRLLDQQPQITIKADRTKTENRPQQKGEAEGVRGNS